jgi:hypothetical protein
MQADLQFQDQGGVAGCIAKEHEVKLAPHDPIALSLWRDDLISRNNNTTLAQPVLSFSILIVAFKV